MLHEIAVTKFEARCDVCLRSSGTLAFHDPRTARWAAIDLLMALGWQQRPRRGTCELAVIEDQREGRGLWTCLDCPPRTR